MAAENFQLIREAYHTLKDPVARSNYDATIAAQSSFAKFSKLFNLARTDDLLFPAHSYREQKTSSVWPIEILTRPFFIFCYQRHTSLNDPFTANYRAQFSRNNFTSSVNNLRRCTKSESITTTTDNNGCQVTLKETTIYWPDGSSETTIEEIGITQSSGAPGSQAIPVHSENPEDNWSSPSYRHNLSFNPYR